MKTAKTLFGILAVAGILLSSTSRANASLQFNGSNTKAVLDGNYLDGVTHANYTFEVWIKPYSLGWMTILGKAAYWKEWHLSITPAGGLDFSGAWVSSYWGFTAGTNIITTNVWQHVCCSVTNGLASFYVNGNFVSSGTIQNPIDFAANTVGGPLLDSTMCIGYGGSGTTPDGSFYNGLIYGIKVWSRTLSANEVMTIATTGSPLTTNGLYNAVILNEGSGTTIHDSLTSLTGRVLSATWSTDNPPAAPQGWLTNGLVAYYPFNGNANDASGHGNNGQILNGNFTADRFGNSLSAFQRPTPQVGWDWGIDTQISNYFSTNLTLALWFKMPSTVSGILITHGIPGSVDPYISVTQGQLTFRVSAPQNWLDYHDSSVTEGVWHSVVATISGTADCLYFDGKLVLVGNNPTPSSSGTWKLGPMAGDYDDVRIYNRALSASEVAQLYAIESTQSSIVVSNANYGLITNQQPTFAVATTNGTMLEEFDYIVTGPFDHTTPALQNGNIYKLTISGRVSVGPNVGDPNSTPDVAYMFVNWQNLDLVHAPVSWICSDWDGIPNRRPFPDVYSTNHVYDYYVIGTGTGLAFSFRDNPYGDNIGGFHVKINNLGLQGAVPTPPNINNQPLSQTVNQGSPVSFSVNASGTGLNYQWKFNTGNISGATNASYYLASTTTNNAGNYTVVVSNAGGSVTSSNAVLIVIPPPRTGTGTATLSGVFVVGVNLVDGGSGYTNTPLVRLIGGGGSGAQAVAVVSNGVVIAINVINAGYGYTSAPLVVIEPPFISNPVLGIAPMSFLTFSNLTVSGSYQLQESVGWYWTNQPLNFTATDSVFTQMFAGIVGNGDYRLALNPVPAQAFATAQLVNGFVVGASVTAGGSGYVTSPAVSITGGGGTNATMVSHLSGGVVTSLSVTSAGIGYTNTPTIQIGQPPAAAVSPTVQPVMRVDSARLAPYDTYQIQFKPAIGGSWGNWNGGLFSPTAATNSQYLFITNGTGFFRLQFVP